MKKEKTQSMTALPHGNVGMVLKTCYNFCLKIVPLLRDGRINESFWQEVESTSSYGATMRFFENCLKIPYSRMYWINTNDYYYRDYCGCNAVNNQSSDLNLLNFLRCERCDLHNTEALRFNDYCMAPGRLMKDVYNKHLPADVLLVYFLEAGDCPLSQLMSENKENGSSFSSDYMQSFAAQILNAILFMYRNGLAHCDIKPANIMVSGERKDVFRLTDFGSVHSERLHSRSGTKAFLPPSPDRIFNGKGLSMLEQRTLLDGYALAVTIYCMAVGYVPMTPSLVAEYKVMERWPGMVFEVFETLYDIWNLTIGKMESLLRRLKEETPFAIGNSSWRPLPIYMNDLCFRFEVMQRGRRGISFGRYHEQLRINDSFDPLMKISGEIVRQYRRLKIGSKLQETMPLPLLECYSTNSWNPSSVITIIFHAPDNVRTNKRTVSFDDYIPYSLANISPTDEDVEEIMRLADVAKEELEASPNFCLWIPSADDIVRIDGRWKVLWFAGQKPFFEKFDLKEHFRKLCDEAIDNNNGHSALRMADDLVTTALKSIQKPENLHD